MLQWLSIFIFVLATPVLSFAVEWTDTIYIPTFIEDLSQEIYGSPNYVQSLKELNPSLDTKSELPTGTQYKYLAPGYIIRKGDNMRMVSYLFFGKKNKYQTLMKWNPEIKKEDNGQIPMVKMG